MLHKKKKKKKKKRKRERERKNSSPRVKTFVEKSNAFTVLKADHVLINM